jgi:hypothetical protein
VSSAAGAEQANIIKDSARKVALGLMTNACCRSHASSVDGVAAHRVNSESGNFEENHRR